MGLASTNGAAFHVAALIRKGALTQAPGLARTLCVVDLPSRREAPALAVSIVTIRDLSSRPVANFYPFATNARGTDHP